MGLCFDEQTAARQPSGASLVHSGSNRGGSSRYDQRLWLALADDFVLQLRAEGEDYAWVEVDLAQLLTEVYEWELALAWTPGQAAVVKVSDEGEGISAANLPRLFERSSRFQQKEGYCWPRAGLEPGQDGGRATRRYGRGPQHGGKGTIFTVTLQGVTQLERDGALLHKQDLPARQR